MAVEEEIESDGLLENQVKLNERLAKIYLNPEDPGSLGGVERLYQRARRQAGLRGLTRNQVRRFLGGESAYSLHRQARRHFTRNHTYVAGIDDVAS